MDLNNPEIRQDLLRQRLKDGDELVAARLAAEFSISLDTARRDLLALERKGLARRVRGGAVPVARPAEPLRKRHVEGVGVSEVLIARALAAIGDVATLILDGGTTVLAVAKNLPAQPGRLVLTPSPFIACALFERGIDTVILPGRLSAFGGIAVGGEAQDMLAGSAADIAVLGVCGLDPAFGLSSDDLMESAVKRAMALAASKVLALAGADKLGRRARHKTLAPGEIDIIATDAPMAATRGFSEAGIEVLGD